MQMKDIGATRNPNDIFELMSNESKEKKTLDNNGCA